MSNKFTNEMVDVLNELLGDMYCAFRYKLVTSDLSGNVLTNPHIQIVPVSDRFIESCIFNLSKGYYDWLETTCKDRWGITLGYNNTKSIIWSNEGWN